MKKININPELKIQKIPIPNEASCIYIIDDFLENPEEIIHFAKNIAYFNQVGADGTLYPGKRDLMPMPYRRALEDFLQELLAVEACYKGKKVDVFRSLLSITTVDESELITAQKMPHIDTILEDEFACVHYFCGPELGGTSLYEYVPRNTISITEKNKFVIDEMLEQVEKNKHEHQGYLRGDTSLFKRVQEVDAKYNRIVIYQGNLLHCANLPAKAGVYDDVSKGRLSIASFFAIE